MFYWDFFLGTAHCANMYPPAPTDLPQLQKARMTIRAFLNEWLSKDDFDDTTSIDNITLTFNVQNLNA